MMERKCENCNWWEFHDYSTHILYRKIGWCTRFPPIFKDKDNPEIDNWPNTYDVSNCGEFQPKKIDNHQS